VGGVIIYQGGSMKNYEKNIAAFTKPLSSLLFAMFAFWLVYKLQLFLFAKC
jgi:hypothetical protein